jgi:hypothetical protein
MSRGGGRARHKRRTRRNGFPSQRRETWQKAGCALIAPTALLRKLGMAQHRAGHGWLRVAPESECQSTCPNRSSNAPSPRANPKRHPGKWKLLLKLWISTATSAAPGTDMRLLAKPTCTNSA